MEDRYAEAIIDELERIGDLLQYMINLQVVRAGQEGIKDIPHQNHRRPEGRRSVKVGSAPKREQP